MAKGKNGKRYIISEKLKFEFKIKERGGNEHVFKRNSEGQKGQYAPHVKIRMSLAKKVFFPYSTIRFDLF
jgi:hypothetical protein